MSQQLLLGTLKKILKNKKMSYKDLGSLIHLSESGVKKLFTAKDISMSRLTQICEALGLRLSDLILLNEEEEIKSVEFTSKQMEALFSQPLLFRIYWRLAIEEKDSKDISKNEKLSSSQIEKSLLKLQRLELLRLDSKKQISFVHKGIYRWVGDNKLLNKLNHDWSYNTLDKVLKNKNNKDLQSLHRLSYLKLKPSTQTQFFLDLHQLVDTYARKSQREKMEVSKKDLAPTSLVIAAVNSEFLDPL